MVWDDEIDLSKRKLTLRLIVERARARGWRVCGFKTDPALFLFHIPGRPQPVRIFAAAPSQTSYAAIKIAKDKYITSQILQDQGLPVPQELLVHTQEAIDKARLEEFLCGVQRLVVKPLDGAHGDGITTDVTDIEKLEEAIKVAQQASTNEYILLQQQIPGFDVRVVCINYEFADAISRTPASVIGDGIHSIQELITITNHSDERGEAYHAKLGLIPEEQAARHLGSEALRRTPAPDEVVQVLGVSNVGMGGMLQNIQHQIPDWLKVLACEAAKALELPVCGVDFIVREIPTITSSRESLDPSIIEVNGCPRLVMHDDISSPEQQKVIDQYLDLVASY